MSLLTEFVTSALSQASAIIGTETVTIAGGTALNCVLNQIQDQRDLVDGGFDMSPTLDAVCDMADFIAAYPHLASSYLGKIAVARERNWRVTGIETRNPIVVIHLTDTAKA
jgi:tRNA A37 threonylcarbamoyltransferase TsaD